MIRSLTTDSMTLQTIDVTEIGRYFDGSRRLPFLKNGVIGLSPGTRQLPGHKRLVKQDDEWNRERVRAPFKRIRGHSIDARSFVAVESVKSSVDRTCESVGER